VATCPLEVVKTRLQAKSNKSDFMVKHRFGFGTINAILTLLKTEGFFALYRGLGAHITGAFPSRAISFFIYGNLKGKIETTEISQVNKNLVPLISALVAGFCVVTITQPIWLAKTRLQLQTLSAKETLYNGIVDCLRKTYRNEGLHGLYRGMGASYLGLTETALQFVLYENLKNRLINFKKNNKYDNKGLSILEYLGVSSFAKLLASLATYPHEVIRTRLREQKSGVPKYKGPIHGMAVLYREEGVRGLYGGLSAHLIRVVPNAAILFLTYELTLALSVKLIRKE